MKTGLLDLGHDVRVYGDCSDPLDYCVLEGDKDQMDFGVLWIALKEAPARFLVFSDDVQVHVQTPGLAHIQNKDRDTAFDVNAVLNFALEPVVQLGLGDAAIKGHDVKARAVEDWHVALFWRSGSNGLAYGEGCTFFGHRA